MGKQYYFFENPFTIYREGLFSRKPIQSFKMCLVVDGEKCYELITRTAFTKTMLSGYVHYHLPNSSFYVAHMHDGNLDPCSPSEALKTYELYEKHPEIKEILTSFFRRKQEEFTKEQQLSLKKSMANSDAEKLLDELLSK